MGKSRLNLFALMVSRLRCLFQFLSPLKVKRTSSTRDKADDVEAQLNDFDGKSKMFFAGLDGEICRVLDMPRSASIQRKKLELALVDLIVLYQADGLKVKSIGVDLSNGQIDVSVKLCQDPADNTDVQT